MDIENVTPYRETLLGTQRLRELIRAARGGFAPDQVARTLVRQMPAVLEQDAAEVAELLAGLAATSRGKLNEAGYEPLYGEGGTAPNLQKREREYVVQHAALLAHYCAALMFTGRHDEARAIGREALAWCRVGADATQTAIQWRIQLEIERGRGDLGAAEQAGRKAVEAARTSKDDLEIVAALDELCSVLIDRGQLEEAEEVNREALALLRKKVKEENRGSRYAKLLVAGARIGMERAQYAESIQTLREAMRWADGDVDPAGRAALFAHLGAVYQRLEHHRQSIECQHAVIQLAEAAGSNVLRAWGYYRLAEAHLALGETEAAGDALDRADAAAEHQRDLRPLIRAKRAALFAATGRSDEAIDLCRRILVASEGAAGEGATGEGAASEGAGGDSRRNPDVEIFAHRTLAEIMERREEYPEAESSYRRAIEIAETAFPQRAPAIKLCLAEVQRKRGHDEGVTVLLEEILRSTALTMSEQARAFRLRALLAEARGELRDVVEFEREAYSLERALLERQAEQSLRNARIVAETDLLEREADLERERRRRVERELADAIVELGDRKRVVESVEQRLRRAISQADAEKERPMINVLRETLASLREGSRPQESPLHYLSGLDDEFFARLRQRWPELTPKQERLCGLLRAGLSSKEIGALMDLEPEGLKAQRKRLRKRLGLAPDDSLENVMATV